MRSTTDRTPRILARKEHDLSRKQISENAIKVLYRLHRAGYVAYLVGGGVRDLLLGRRPKDFDIATNAHPEEIRRLFRNSRVIGRRFRLVHVFFKGEIVEVSTFRASPEPPEGPDDWTEGDLEARELEVPVEPLPKGLKDDNTFGTPEEDAWRRDLTVNSLFYDIGDFSIIDWVGGLEDLERGIIRTVGPPEQRFEEDPVRMMRALEYGVRLGFDLAPETEAAIRSQCELISQAAPARLNYELMEGLRSGHASGIWKKWGDFGLLTEAFPELDEDSNTVRSILRGIDEKVATGSAVGDPTISAALFLPRFTRLMEEMTDDRRGRLNNVEFMERLRELLEPASTRMQVSNYTMHLMFHGLFSLTKMRRAPERGRQVIKLSRHESFPVARDLLALGASVDLLSHDACRGWEKAIAQLQKAEDPVAERFNNSPNRRHRRRRRRRSPKTVEKSG